MGKEGREEEFPRERERGGGGGCGKIHVGEGWSEEGGR